MIPGSSLAPNLAHIGAVGGCPACRIDIRIPNQQVVIRAVRTERVIARRPDFRACLPPSMLAAHYVQIERVIEASTGPHGTVWTFHHDPITRIDIARSRSGRMHLHLGVW